jgi:hypothetical protein
MITTGSSPNQKQILTIFESIPPRSTLPDAEDAGQSDFRPSILCATRRTRPAIFNTAGPASGRRSHVFSLSGSGYNDFIGKKPWRRRRMEYLPRAGEMRNIEIHFRAFSISPEIFGAVIF